MRLNWNHCLDSWEAEDASVTRRDQAAQTTSSSNSTGGDPPFTLAVHQVRSHPRTSQTSHCILLQRCLTRLAPPSLPEPDLFPSEIPVWPVSGLRPSPPVHKTNDLLHSSRPPVGHLISATPLPDEG